MSVTRVYFYTYWIFVSPLSILLLSGKRKHWRWKVCPGGLRGPKRAQWGLKGQPLGFPGMLLVPFQLRLSIFTLTVREGLLLWCE